MGSTENRLQKVKRKKKGKTEREGPTDNILTPHQGTGPVTALMCFTGVSAEDTRICQTSTFNFMTIVTCLLALLQHSPSSRATTISAGPGT